jgi:hypothetical protein
VAGPFPVAGAAYELAIVNMALLRVVLWKYRALDFIVVEAAEAESRRDDAVVYSSTALRYVRGKP